MSRALLSWLSCSLFLIFMCWGTKTRHSVLREAHKPLDRWELWLQWAANCTIAPAAQDVAGIFFFLRSMVLVCVAGPSVLCWNLSTQMPPGVYCWMGFLHPRLCLCWTSRGSHLPIGQLAKVLFIHLNGFIYNLSWYVLFILGHRCYLYPAMNWLMVALNLFCFVSQHTGRVGCRSWKNEDIPAGLNFS